MNEFLEIMSIDVKTLTDDQVVAYSKYKELAVEYLNKCNSDKSINRMATYYNMGVGDAWSKCNQLRIKGFP